MNQAMKLDNITEFMKDMDIETIDDKNYIFCYIEPKYSKYLVYQSETLSDIKTLLVFFTREEIILVELSMSGDFTEHANYLDHKYIKDFKYKKGLMQTKITFNYADTKLVIKTPQVVLTSKWQMVNLKYLKDKNFFWK